MLFGRLNRRRAEPVARPALTPADRARGLVTLSNGPDTPIMDVAAMRKALTHAAWRDPSVERRKGDVIRNAVRTLERTAACVDMVAERLSEASDTLTQGKATSDPMMRGLLTARFEELLDSLERVVILAQDGDVNLLLGTKNAYDEPIRFARAAPANSLSLDIGTAGFSYVLSPVDIRRGPNGLAIPVLENGFDDEADIYSIETALIKAQHRVAQFADRLSHDATMLVRIARDLEAAYAVSQDNSDAAKTESDSAA